MGGWYFVESLEGERSRLLPEELHHLRNVSRIKPGTVIPVLDGKGKRGHGRWLGALEVEILDQETLPPPPFSLLLALGDPRGIENALAGVGEMGAREIFLVRSRYSASVRAPSPRYDRWYRLLMAGARISGNPWIPRIHEPVPLGEKLSEIPDDSLVILDPKGAPLSLSLLKTHPPFYLAIGPEGGWDPEEIRGFPTHRLILNPLSQTQAILSALSILTYFWEERSCAA